jgi:hypothetical protein
MKIWDWNQVGLTTFDPRFPLGVLAFWTMTVTATVITDANMPAVIAFINMTTQ